MSDPESKSNLPLKCYDFCVDSEDLPHDPSNIRVACPDFTVLLDHTIGVIWKLMKKDADVGTLDQFHLIWALKFLEGIKPQRGRVSKDVQLLRLLIRKLIVEEYAGADVVKVIPLEISTKEDERPSFNNKDKTLDLDTMEVSMEENTLDLDTSEMGTKDDMNAGFVEEKDESMNMYSFSDDIWYANRRFPIMADESSNVQGFGGFLSKIFGMFK